MTTTIASRVVEFLRTNGASSIQLMSDSLGVPSNRISATISQINAGKSKESARIIGDRVEGKLYSIYSLDSYDAPRAEKKQDVCVAMPGTPAKSHRDIARDALIGYIGNELRLYTPDQLRATQECVKSGDLAFLMADFVSHKHQDALQSAGAEIVIVHGGISSLREAMTTAYVGSSEKKAA